MRKLVLIVAAVTIAGCSTGPISYIGSSPDPQDGLFTCALRNVNEMGYTVVNTDRAAGFITAEKQTSGLGTALLTGNNYHDQLTISLFDRDESTRTMRVTAGQTQQGALAFGAASKTSIAPKDSGKADAMTILTRCAPDGARQQPSPELVFTTDGSVLLAE